MKSRASRRFRLMKGLYQISVQGRAELVGDQQNTKQLLESLQGVIESGACSGSIFYQSALGRVSIAQARMAELESTILSQVKELAQLKGTVSLVAKQVEVAARLEVLAEVDGDCSTPTSKRVFGKR